MVQSSFAYHVSPNSKAGDWYWDVTSGGEVIARGLAPTEVRARADAIAAASSYIDRSEQISIFDAALEIFDAALERPRERRELFECEGRSDLPGPPDRAPSW